MPPSSLTIELMTEAYKQGFFPMPDPQTGEIVWFNPDPRAVIPLEGFKVSRSLQRKLNKNEFSYTINRDFTSVINFCADRDETWINDEIKSAYTSLHRAGHVHSLEVWQQDQLAGGVYGVAIGGAFCAESKFHLVTDASKVALFFLTEHLKERGFLLLEVQFQTPHLQSLGAVEIPAANYLQQLQSAVKLNVEFS